MADYSKYKGKIQNGGATPQGRLSASEWNNFVTDVQKTDDMAKSAVKGISINNQGAVYPGEDGIVKIILTESNYALNLTTTVSGSLPYKIALGNSWKMNVLVASLYVDGEIQEALPSPATVRFYCNGKVVGTQTVYSGETASLDFRDFLTEGENNVYAEVDNGFGLIKNTMTYVVTAVYLECVLPIFNRTAIQSSAWELQVQILGASANVFIEIDGEGGLAGTQSAGSTSTYQITSGQSNGVHKLKVYAVYTEDDNIATEPILEEYIFAGPGATATMIATSQRDGQEVDMYNAIVIPFWIFSPGYSGDKVISLAVRDENNAIISSTRTITFTNGESGLLNYDIALFDAALIGDRYIQIQCDDAVRSIPITINQGATKLNEVSGYDVKLISAGRSNDDDDRDDWSCGDYRITFPEDFDFTPEGSGWNKDSDGNVALHIRRGHEVSLNYFPFASNPAFGNDEDILGDKTGLTISIELATRNCVKQDASVVRCIHEGVGFELFANSMRIASNNESMAADYKEDTHIRIDMVIEGKETVYNWKSGATSGQDSEAFMVIYTDGTYQQRKQIFNTTDFTQTIAQAIAIGSEFCDVDVYAIRIYRSALNEKNIIDNRSFDTPVASDKIAISQRNDVLNSQLKVDLNLLRKARPDLPIIIVEIDDLPATKTWVNLPHWEWDNPKNPDNPDGAAPSLTSDDDEIRTQGTSSTQYPMPFHNYDIKAISGEGVGTLIINGQRYEKWRLYVGSPTGKSATAKKDYASSEMANNAILSMLWNTLSLAAAGSFDTLIAAQKTISQESYRQSLVALPCFMFQKKGTEYTPIGMFNLINYKTDEKVLGFVSPYTWEESRAQSWEIRDNNVFWDTYYSEPYAEQYTDTDENGQEVQKTRIVNDIFRYYETVYPTDSAIDGADFGDCPTEADIPTCKNETKDILRLHNWLVSTNQQLATGNLLDVPYVDSSGNEYKYDTAKYRLAKFVSEANDYLIIDHWCLYYLWREACWMHDSGSKNLGLRTDDGLIWRPKARDCDTGIGCDNEGKFVFPFYVEDIDYRIGTQFVFNETGKLTKLPEGASTVCNGQFGALWVNIRDGFMSRLQALFSFLYNNAEVSKFDYDNLISWFESHQGEWSESLYNFGAHQYYGGAPFTKWLDSGLGDKKHQRRNWLYYGFRYRASKYHAVSTEATKCISFREFGFGSDLQIKPYSQLYVCVGFGATAFAQTTRYRCINPEVGVTVKNEIKQKVEDAIIYIFNGDMMVDIGDLYKFGDIGSLNLASASRLRYLRLGSKDDKTTRQYVNTKQTDLNLTNCPALEEIDLTNCEGFGTTAQQNGTYQLTLSKQTALRKLYAYGASFTGCTLPSTPTLETVEFGNKLRNLRLVKLTGLQEFSISGVGDLRTITINGTPGIDTQDIVTRCYHESAALTTVNIDNVDWEDLPVNILEYLTSVPSCVLAGTISIPAATSTTNVVTFTLKRDLIRKFGAVDSGADGLKINYTSRAITNAIITGSDACPAVGKYQFDVTPATAGGVGTIYGNNFSKIEWSIAANPYADIDPQTGEVTVKSIGTESPDGTGPTAVITCTITLLDGSTVTADKVIRLYERSAKVGDYVFADGSFSDIRDKSKTVVGVCFYINPEDATQRLMVATENASPITVPWGLYPHNEGNPGAADREIPGIELESGYDAYDTPMTNNTTHGILKTENGGQDYYISDETYRDESENGDPDGFRILKEGSSADTLKYITLKEAFHGWPAGAKIPHGLYLTLQLIDHRDTVLSELGIPLPAASETQTEKDSLTELMANIVAENGNDTDYRQFYFPAASYCHAYEPKTKTGEVLSEKFRKGMWALPSFGELCRLYWYHSKGYEGADHAIFTNAAEENVFTKIKSGNHWSSLECSRFLAWYVHFGSGSANHTDRYYEYYCRAVAAF